MFIDDIDINYLIYYVGLDLRALSGDVFFSGYVVHRVTSTCTALEAARDSR